MRAVADTLLERLKAANADHWRAYVRHPFVRALGSGTLPRASFEHYLRQDYVFLIHFARAFGLAAFKSRDLEELRAAKSSMAAILDVELDLHVAYCARWGIDATTLAATVESTANMAYTRYVMERGLAGELLDLNVALAPCIVGYAEVAAWLSGQPFLVREGNPYLEWIELYAGEEYRAVADAHRATLDVVDPAALAPGRLADLERTFGAATRLEIGFWQMGLERT